MKKYLIIIAFIFLAGCASAPFVPDRSVNDRAYMIFTKVNNELKTDIIGAFAKSNDGLEVNAWVDSNRMYTTVGIFQYDDDTVTFIMAHELSHAKLNHVRNKRILGLGITAGMIVVNMVVPGAGLLNHAINPAIVNNFSKPQELEADKLASETCLKLGIPLSKQIEIMNELRKASNDSGGGFWSQHPSWDDRIENISR
jgi:Zn-dependent protease with chaperone function